MTADLHPTFSTAMRGYDRTEVDKYTARLLRMLEDAQRAANRGPSGQEPPPAPAPDFAALGERITTMLRLAEEEAHDLRRRGDQEAQALVARAREEAEQLRASATLDVEKVQAAMANADRERQEVLAAARREAEDLLGRARRHAEDQAEGILAQAEADARRVLEEARQSAQARLQEAERRYGDLEAATQQLEQRHKRVLQELARVRAALISDIDEEPPADDPTVERTDQGVVYEVSPSGQAAPSARRAVDSPPPAT
jgi:cell division septum initiation protein DivIVA